ncbi:MAG: MalM family protein [Arenicellales bacterium]
MRSLHTFKKVVLGFSLLALGACAGTGNNHYMLSTQAQNETFETMTFKTLPAAEKVRLAVNSADPSFQFKGGYSHYEALALPDMSQAYVLQLESEVVRTAQQGKGEIFFPVLTFLDAKKQAINTYDALPYTMQTPFYARKHIRASIKISGALADARYVVIHTTDKKLDQAIASGDGKSILQSGGFNTMVFAPITKPRYRTNFGREGWVRVLAYLPQ